jgi:flavin-dependent dehydrogenase
MTVPDQCDVAIIGGGPAGSLAGTFLSQMGYDVVLFDKQKHPRYQVGESLIPDFWRYCDEAGVSDRIAAEGFIQKAGGSVSWNGVMHRISFKDFGYTRPALHVERDRFDHILLEHAKEQGASVIEEVSVLRADFDRADEVQVVYRSVGGDNSGQIGCRFVIDASGQNAVVGKQLGLRAIDPAFRFMSVWGYFEGSHYLAADGNIYPAEKARTTPPTTYVTSIPEAEDLGWAWHILLRECTSVGLVLPRAFAKATKAPGESWEAYFLRQCEALPLMRRLLAESRFCEGSVRLIRDYSYRSTQVAGPGFFLIGDAAGFIDPIFSVGMVLAMYSAHAAAWAIDRCFKEPERLETHQEIFTNQMQSRLELGRSLALPRYQTTDRASNQAKEAVQFASIQSQELMHAASLMTARSENFEDMVDDERARKVSPGKLQVVGDV